MSKAQIRGERPAAPPCVPTSGHAGATPTADPLIQVELRRGALHLNLQWPASAAQDCTAWLRELSAGPVDVAYTTHRCLVQCADMDRELVRYDARKARQDHAMLKLWGRISSINVRKVVLTAQLLEVPFERIDAGATFGITNTPEYLARNPNALVPTLEDDDFVLWESNAIVRYLSAKYPQGGLYPQDLRTRFDAERWMDWQQTTLNGAGREAFLQFFRTPEDKRNLRAIAASEAATKPMLALLDAHLAQRPYMAGERLTMADIPIACEMHRWWGLPLHHAEHPHLRRWYDGLRLRPAARGALDVALT